MERSRRRWPVWASAPVLLIVILISFANGQYPIAPLDLVHVVMAKLFGAASTAPAAVETVVWEVRLPRVLAGLVVGAALAAAGATYQGLLRNPLVSPDILGVTAGASLGAVVGIFLSLPVFAIQALSFAGGIAGVALVYAIGAAVRAHDPTLVLVLAGIAVGSFLGACVSLLKVLADPYDQLPAITYWLLGSLSAVTRGDVMAVAPAMALGLAPLVLLRWRINLMSLGDEEAQALGVNTRLLRGVLIAAATLLTSAAVSITGVIGWIGLVIPHVARMLVGPDFIKLLPTSLLLGAGYLVGVDTLARSATTMEIPLGVLTAALGAPFFLYLLATSQRVWR